MSHEIIFIKKSVGFNEAMKLENAIFMAQKNDSWVFHKYFMGFL